MPLTKLDGGLSTTHAADADVAVQWLSYLSPICHLIISPLFTFSTNSSISTF